MTTPKTHIVGLIGRDIGKSRSPEMHEKEANELGIPLAYRLIDMTAIDMTDDELPDVLNFVQGIGFSGVNVTYPFKQKIIPHLDAISDDAKALGAVNTVAFKDGIKIGHNVDWSGYAENFRLGLEGVTFDTVGQIGAGGAGAATAYAMLSMGCKDLRIFDIDRSKVEALKTRLQRAFPDVSITVCAAVEGACHEVDGIVQASPVGMYSVPGNPVPVDLIKREMWVSDIVYFPEETELLKIAKAKGCKTLSGSGMAINQAAEAFNIFTSVPPDVQRMRESFVRTSG